MNKLLKEFLSYIVTEVKREPNSSWETAGGWSAKRSDGTRQSGFRSKEAADAWLAGTGRAPSAEKEPSGEKKKPADKPTKPARKPKKTSVGKVNTSGLDKSSEVVRTSITSMPGGQGVWAAITGQMKIRGGMGAGTPESKAAEASKVVICNALIRGKPQGVSMRDYIQTPEAQQMIGGMLTDLQNAPGSKLTESWVPTVRAQVVTSLIGTEETFGEIESIVWDNEEGRTALGLGRKVSDDRSDSYIKLKDGRIIGTSLKKSGKVFLANLGYAKSMTQMQAFTDADDEETRAVLLDMRDDHRVLSNQAISDIITNVQQNTDLQNKIRAFNRSNFPDLQYSAYDKFFNDDGSIKIDESGVPLVIQELDPKNPRPSSERTKALLKILSSVDSDSTSGLRNVDAKATQQLMDNAKNNPKLRKVLSRFMANQLDIPQMLSAQPFEGSPVSAITTVYGEGSVTESGEAAPLFVHGGSLRSMFGIPDGTSDEEAQKYVEDNLYIDSDADSPLGIVRLRITNPSGKPPYFYPIISTVGLRARGLGEAATMECLQHDAWTHMLSAGSPDPSKWTPEQRRANAESTLRFLERQRASATSDEQRSAIQEEMRQYAEIYKQNS